MKKQFLTLVTSLLLLVGLTAPALVFAEDQPPADSPSTESTETTPAEPEKPAITRERVDTIIDNRLKALKKVKSRLEASKNVTSSHKKELLEQIESSITKLDSYHQRVEEHKDNPELLAKDYNDAKYDFYVHSLMVPKTLLIIQADGQTKKIDTYQKWVNKNKGKISKQNSKVKDAFAKIQTNVAEADKNQTALNAAVKEMLPLTPAEFAANKPTVLKDTQKLLKANKKALTAADAEMKVIRANKTTPKKKSDTKGGKSNSGNSGSSGSGSSNGGGGSGGGSSGGSSNNGGGSSSNSSNGNSSGKSNSKPKKETKKKPAKKKPSRRIVCQINIDPRAKSNIKVRAYETRGNCSQGYAKVNNMDWPKFRSRNNGTYNFCVDKGGWHQRIAVTPNLVNNKCVRNGFEFDRNQHHD